MNTSSNPDCSNLFYAHLLALRTRSIPRFQLGQFRFVQILSYIYLSNNHLFFTSPLRKLIFRHYILSFPLSYHTSSGITQITFLNALSKSPYKQMQSLTRNNHITSNHLPLLLFTTSKDIFIRIFSIAALFSRPAEPYLCAKD